MANREQGADDKQDYEKVHKADARSSLQFQVCLYLCMTEPYITGNCTCLLFWGQSGTSHEFTLILKNIALDAEL